MQYHHTQNAPLFLLVLAVAFALVLAAVIAPGPEVQTVIFSVAAAVVALIGFCFRSLTITDEGQRLAVRFGPIPLFGTSIEYSEVSDVRRGKSSLVDGWGIHWVPGRGWTYNLWGFDCVEMQLGKRLIRVGSDDAENLTAFLRQRTSQR